MVKRVSAKLAKGLGAELQSNEDEISIFDYALEVILYSIIKLIVIIGSAYLLGLLEITMAYLVSFITLRRFGGGVHLSTYGRCLSIGLLSTIFCAKLADSISVGPEILLLMAIILLLVGCICIWCWVPAGTHKNRVAQVNQRMKRKMKTFMVLLFVLILIGVCCYYQYYNYALSMVLGGFISFYLITPMGYKTIYAIDNIINDKKERRKENA